MDDYYEWDEDMNHANFEKPGYDFNDLPVMEDGDYVQLEGKTKAGELRKMWITWLYGHLVAAVITRRPQAIRIISLRRAGHDERRAYHEAFRS